MKKGARFLAALAIAGAGAAPPAMSQQLNADALRSYGEYQTLAPHRAFALAPDGRGNSWSGASGADPTRAVESVLKRCEERAKSPCTVYAVNNVVLAGRGLKTAPPPPLPPIRRLRPEAPWA